MKTLKGAALLALVVAVFGAGWLLGTRGGAAEAGALSDFKCYNIPSSEAHNPPHIVNLQSQFGLEENVEVGLAELVCAPVEKTVVSGEELRVRGKAEHLKCYNIPPHQAQTDNEVILTTQFGVEGTLENPVDVTVARFLCVAAAKEVVPATP